MKSSIKFALTPEQVEALQPLMDTVEAYNIVSPDPGAVLMQVWSDGEKGYAKAYFIYPEEAEAIQQIVQGDEGG